MRRALLTALFMGGTIAGADAVCKQAEESPSECSVILYPGPLAEMVPDLHLTLPYTELVPPRKVKVEYFTVAEPEVADTIDEEQ